MPRGETRYLYNPSPKKLTGLFVGGVFEIEPGEVLPLNGWAPDGRTLMYDPDAAAVHLLKQWSTWGAIEYDYAKAIESGQDDYNREIRIKGLHSYVAAVDAQIEVHQRMNDERKMQKLNPIGETPGLRYHMAARKAAAAALEAAGESVVAMPEVEVPEFKMTDLRVPASPRPPAPTGPSTSVPLDAMAPPPKKAARA